MNSPLRRSTYDVDMNSILANGILETAPQHPFDDTAKGGNQTEEAKAVGENTRCDEKRCRNQNDRSVDERVCRDTAFRHFCLDLTHHPEPLSSGERCADHSGQHDQNEGVQRAEAASQFDQQREFDGGKNDEEKKESAHIRMMPQRADRSSPV